MPSVVVWQELPSGYADARNQQRSRLYVRAVRAVTTVRKVELGEIEGEKDDARYLPRNRRTASSALYQANRNVANQDGVDFVHGGRYKMLYVRKFPALYATSAAPASTAYRHHLRRLPHPMHKPAPKSVAL